MHVILSSVVILVACVSAQEQRPSFRSLHNVPESTEPAAAQQYVILTSIGRSGSTLLMDLLTLVSEEHTDAFSMYEPFWAYPPTTATDKDVKIGPSWRSMFQCKFPERETELKGVLWHGMGRNKVAEQMIRANPHWLTSSEQRLFLNRNWTVINYDYMKHSSAVAAYCKKATIRMVKTIRMTGYVKQTLPLHLLREQPPDHDRHHGDDDGTHTHDNDREHAVRPKLRIVHLIRHPKDVAKSYSRFNALRGWNSNRVSGGSAAATFSETVLGQVKGMCNRMKADVDFFNALETKHPGSVLRVKYEDVKEDAQTALRTVSTFLGLTWSEKDGLQVDAAMAAIRGPTVACIGESQCPLQLGANGVTRKRSKPWPLPAACPAHAAGDDDGFNGVPSDVDGAAVHAKVGVEEAEGGGVSSSNDAASHSGGDVDAQSAQQQASASDGARRKHAIESDHHDDGSEQHATKFDAEWESFWSTLESPDECKYISNLAGYEWQSTANTARAVGGDAAAPAPAPATAASGTGGGNGGNVSPNGADREMFEFDAAGYGLIQLTLDQLRAYVERFEAVLDGSSAFRTAHAKFEAANTATEEAWRHVGAAFYHPEHINFGSASSSSSAAGSAAENAGVTAVRLAASALVMLACDFLLDIAKLPAPTADQSGSFRPEMTSKLKRWSIVGRGADSGGAGSVLEYATEFDSIYHAAAIAGVLPDEAKIVDYEAKHQVILQMASALMWQRRWKLAHEKAERSAGMA